MSGADTATGLVPSAYADAFVRGPPREGVQRVQNRLHKARILADELADYFAARRELESTYLKQLQKIAKRSFLSDATALGPNFLPVYERLIAEIGEVARIHGDLEKKYEVECEMPIRQASQKGDWGRIKEHDDNLAGTLKEISTLESQLAKDQKKVEAASAKKAQQAQQKVQETERSLRQTMELWETEAPFSFEAYQRIDASRLELMKEVVAKFETAQSDAATRLMQMTEQSMQVALNFEPQTDMQEFVLKNGTAKGALGRPTNGRGNRAAEDSLQGGGTVRQGNANAYPTSTITPSAPINQQSSNGVSEFGRAVQPSSASLRSVDRPESREQTNTPSKSGGSTLKSALTRFGRGKSNKNANEAASSNYGTLSEGPSSMAPPSGARGMQRAESQRSLDSRSDADTSAALPGSLMAPMAPTTLSSANTPSRIPAAPPQIDAEGFTIPPANRDRKPWENENTADVSSPSNLMDDDTSTFSDPNNAASKVAAMSITQQPILEDEASDQAALERMRSTLLTARSPAMPPQRRNTTRRDRRDVRNTTYNPMMEDGAGNRISTFGLSNFTGSPAQTSSPSAFVGTPGTGPERSQSIVSSGSASNVGNATLDSIASAGPIASGLNGQITERVNVVTNGRTVSKIMVVGEVSISVRDIPASAPVHLRIDDFEQLEKAAANPQFLKELSGKPGEYTLDLGAIARYSGGAGGVAGSGRAAVLKYQLHVPQHKAEQYVPLNISPQWRCEDNQTSILINYSSNSESRLVSAAQPVGGANIQDITMSVDITSSNVSNIMSKPNATYSADQKKLLWRLNEPLPVIGGSSAAQKALARFQVGNKSEIKPIEVRWKIPGLSVSSLGLSLMQSDSVSFASISRQIVSGKYVAHP
ncbi:uncharacterized protein FA14DRAFT_160311 [Meira miltonrushii]|uniref:MHD domain-containing protein n=1 Tax=Meira miltonrushii TaxID=1280837 RepID=A0A316VBP9_9BASI|nr:uncharacterized protein FA14DRAFT_160311 [Meira miltonrushii]PWN34900.1 hypothetical protein FA14DRAFT_160311 [Meira miltonrushii]